MNKRFFVLLIIPIFVGRIALHGQDIADMPALPFACTGFAVYGDKPVYGMNFDYPDVEVRFAIHTTGDRKVFQAEFQQDGNFVPTVGMNSDGLFASLQMLFPEEEDTEDSSEDVIYTWQLFGEALFFCGTVKEVDTFLRDKKVKHRFVTLHNLFADTGGDAMIVEVGDNANLITRIKDDFIVMTNFCNAKFKDKNYEEVEGSGAGRYQTAYRNILDHLESFDRNCAFKTLEKTKLETKNFRTQCSLVFDPEHGEVYIALRRKFDRVWRVSIKEGVIETYTGFREAKKMVLDASGVLASELLDAD